MIAPVPPTDSPLALPYCADRLHPARRRTRVVRIGDVAVGGDEPIRVQSMTTTFTWDVDATLAQIERLVGAGCEIVRVTVPTQRDADALPGIREGLRRRGLRVPLVADIHFAPKLALLACAHVDKVRINPGNFTDSKRFAVQTYTDAEYAAELARIEERFTPLVLEAKRRGVAMRIGTNHGSLSDRIMNRYGDSPEGMVESALEFVRICERHDYRELVLSMKASNTHVMVQAYRLLAARMAAEGMDYPFHLGVTEAGDGDDARIKSAIGIGGLLQDGIGDTIRVSLTEDPVAEVPVGFGLAARGGPHLCPAPAAPSATTPCAERVGFYAFARRATARADQGPAACALGADQDLRVELDLGRPAVAGAARLAALVRELGGERGGDRRLEVLSLDLAHDDDVAALEALRAALAGEDLGVALDARLRPALRARLEREGGGEAGLARVARACDRLTLAGATTTAEDARAALAALAAACADGAERALGLEVEAGAGLEPTASGASQAPEAVAARAAALVAAVREARDGASGANGGTPPHVVVCLRQAGGDPTAPLAPVGRALAAALDASGHPVPFVLVAAARGEHPLLDAATHAGGLLTDGLGDALRLEGPSDPRKALDWAYRILQGARRRTTQTEYISCPGCGRTLFELEPVTAAIKARTSHLKGVKIAVMGCIVNGPGEMADADFGYVGWKPGKVNLYVGRECVVREVDEDAAPDRLVDLIKAHGRWVDAPAATPEGAAV